MRSAAAIVYLPPPAADTASACFWPCGTTIAYLPRNRVVSGWAITASGYPEAVITGSVPSLTRIPADVTADMRTMVEHALERAAALRDAAGDHSRAVWLRHAVTLSRTRTPG